MSLLSIELPPSCAQLVTEAAFEKYTDSVSNNRFKSELDQLTVDHLFPSGVSDQQLADCCLSGIWLLHNFLDQSHEISQEIPSREGSYWHGIMHRMEGDFWNSKYWFRKVGNHPVFQVVAENWDTASFVDQCEAASRGDFPIEETRQTAVKEWKALFEYCFVNAT